MTIKRKNVSSVQSFTTKEDGGIAMFSALALPLVLGFAGLGVETASWYNAAGQAQVAADVAAHAAAMELEEAGLDQELADTVAINAAMQLGYQPQEVSTLATSTSAGIKVDVTIEKPVRRYFSSIFDSVDVKLVKSAASALVESAGEACLLALDPDGDGVQFGGNTDVSLNNCFVMSNAEKNNSLGVTGSAGLAAACAATVGTANLQKSHAVKFSDCHEARERAKPTIDPYAGFAIPSLTSGTFGSCASLPVVSKGKGKGKKSSSTTSPLVQSGRYCGGIKFSGVMVAEDGATLIIDGGDFSNQGPATFMGENITIILINDASIQLTSQATLNLKAKTTGEYAGMIFAGDANSQDTDHKFNGGSDSTLQGAIYLPGDKLELRGGANVTVGCLHLIAGEIDARGNSRFSNNCGSAGTKPLLVSGGIRLTAS